NYECALALDPSDSHIQTNLKQALKKLDINEPNSSIIAQIAHNLTASGWAWVASLSAWILVALLVFPRMYNKSGILAYTGCALCIALLVTAGISLN
ncbi:MAG TPA: hypothetical protein PLV25_02855, partial [Opitutales bacterium]|nr:hypothetical protein [Opitutales bacterium]